MTRIEGRILAAMRKRLTAAQLAEAACTQRHHGLTQREVEILRRAVR